jgi:ThiF family
MIQNKKSKRFWEKIKQKYPRENRNVDFELVHNTTLFIVGLGAFGHSAETFSSIGINRLFLSEKDTVETKNLISQNFISSDIGKRKDKAIERRLKECSFEKDNPDFPPIQIILMGDFLAIKDEELQKIIDKEKEEGRKIIFIMASDYHFVQARGNRISRKFGVPVFWVGVYRMGMAGEIIFYLPGYNLPCYRCITESRYRFNDKNRLSNHLKSDYSGSAQSAGLPSSTKFIDSILELLVLGLILIDCNDNQHGRLFKRLLNEKRNFIQCQLDPDYMLNDSENIFSQIQGPDLIAFNTIFQQEQRKIDCLDCSPIAANSVWQNTDYTRENYQESLELFSGIESAFAHGGRIEHRLLKEYESYFPEWEELLNSKLLAEGDFELIIERNDKEVFKINVGQGPTKKGIRNVKPGTYVVRSSANSILWQGELLEKELVWTQAFPEEPLQLAADTGEIFLHPTKEINLLNNKISIRVFPEIESGRLELEIKNNDLS